MLYFDQCQKIHLMEELILLDALDYQILVDLFEYKNITRVAQIHFLSQPAITKRLKKIEEELGCELTIRTNKGIMFNAIGESIIPYCRTMIQQSAAIKNLVNEKQGVVGGTLNIIASPNYCRYRLPSALKAYAQKYPNVDINITTGKSKDIYFKLFQREDCVIIIRGEQNWDGNRVLLSSEPMCLIYSHENAGRSFNDYNYIYHKTDVKVVSQIEQWAEENKISLNRSKLMVADISGCKEMVQSGIGWCVLPRICLDDFDGVIKPLSFKDGSPFIRNSYALYHNSYYELKQVKLFIEALIENERYYD